MILATITNEARHFKPIWREGDRDAAFLLCNQIRVKTGVPEYTKNKFDEGCQYRTIFHEKWKVAKDEFINLVFGWW